MQLGDGPEVFVLMKIPKNTKQNRYYVAKTTNKAWASFKTYEEARQCLMKHLNLTPPSDVIGVIKTSLAPQALCSTARILAGVKYGEGNEY